MNDFEQLKHVWQQQIISASSIDIAQLKKTNSDAQRKLEQTQLWPAFWLLLTAVILIASLRSIWMGFFFGIKFHSLLTYAAVVLIALISAVQGFINLAIYARLRRIDVALPATQHLAQWQRYYAFRKQLVRVDIPLYYVVLNGAFGLYFIEILALLPQWQWLTALALYAIWMLYAYFILGKRTIRREHERLELIIKNLQAIAQQLSPETDSK